MRENSLLKLNGFRRDWVQIKENEPPYRTIQFEVEIFSRGREIHPRILIKAACLLTAN